MQSNQPIKSRAWEAGRAIRPPPFAVMRTIGTLDIKPGQLLPARVVYAIGGSLVPEPTSSPDRPPAIPVTVPEGYGHKRLANGLRPRWDAMARYMAHGATASDAYRAAFNYTGEPPKVASKAFTVTRVPKFAAAMQQYARELEEEARQPTFAVRDFVLSRLVLEAQTAKQDGARIMAVRLLGMSEGMFIDVKRTEKTIDPAQLESLKAQLEQRLRLVLSRIPAASLPYHGTQGESGTGETVQGDPHAPDPPLFPSGSHAQGFYTNPLTSSLTLEHPPFSGEGPIEMTLGDISAPDVQETSVRELTLADLGL